MTDAPCGRMKKRPLSEQVLVITGASSGIGLATARLATERGARVLLAARGEARLADAVEKLHAGDRAAYVVTDVSDEASVARLADEAIARFGRIDTWVNDAGAMLYGGTEEVSIEDMRTVFDVV